jgi:hypothetical protein
MQAGSRNFSSSQSIFWLLKWIAVWPTSFFYGASGLAIVDRYNRAVFSGIREPGVVRKTIHGSSPRPVS